MLRRGAFTHGETRPNGGAARRFLLRMMEAHPESSAVASRPAVDWLPVWALCVTQVISWGTLFYAFSVLLRPIGASRGWNQSEMVGAFSVALLASGLAAYPAGTMIHRFEGRLVMSVGSVLAAVALLIVAFSQSLALFFLGWAVAGIAMALTLYEAAFSVLTSLYEVDYKRAVTKVTLAGGFASTVFWPLTESLVGWIGWRQALIFYAGLHLAVCLPAHLFGLRRAGAAQTPIVKLTDPSTAISDLIRQPRFLLLALSYTLNAIVFSIVSVHLIPLLQTKGISPQHGAWLAAVAGPMQVAGRVVEFRFGDRWRAAQTGKVALLVLIPALAGLAIPGAPISFLLVSIGLYGVSNGVMTIVRGLSVVELFGRQGFAQVSGALAAPSTLARAAGPILASLLLAQSTGYFGVLAAMIALASISLVLFARASAPAKHQID